MSNEVSSKQSPFVRPLSASELEFRQRLLADVEKGESFEVIKTRYKIEDADTLIFLKDAVTSMAGERAVNEGQDPYEAARKLGINDIQGIQSLVAEAALIALRKNENLKDVIKKHNITDDNVLVFIKKAATNIAVHQVVHEGKNLLQMARKLGLDDEESIQYLVEEAAAAAIRSGADFENVIEKYKITNTKTLSYLENVVF